MRIDPDELCDQANAIDRRYRKYLEIHTRLLEKITPATNDDEVLKLLQPEIDSLSGTEAFEVKLTIQKIKVAEPNRTDIDIALNCIAGVMSKREENKNG